MVLTFISALPFPDESSDEFLYNYFQVLHEFYSSYLRFKQKMKWLSQEIFFNRFSVALENDISVSHKLTPFLSFLLCIIFSWEIH